MIWTDEKTWVSHRPAESSFLHPSEGFLQNPFRGLEYLERSVVPFLGGGDVLTSTESVYQMNPALARFHNARILLIGAGPSSNNLNVDPTEYDKIVTCNHYFLNKEVCEYDISMVFLGDEVKESDERLKNELSNTNYLVGFENIGRNPEELLLFKKKYTNRVFWAHTRYHSKIGAIPRIASFLCTLSPKSLDIVGMDGYIPDRLRDTYAHAFEQGKGNSGTIESTAKETLIMLRYEEQYLEFWDYVLHDLAPTVAFKNLGHNHPANISTKVLTRQLGGDYQSYLLRPRQ